MGKKKRAWSVNLRANPRVPGTLASSSLRKLSVCGACFPWQSASPLGACFEGQVLPKWAKQWRSWSWCSTAAADPARLCHYQFPWEPRAGFGGRHCHTSKNWVEVCARTAPQDVPRAGPRTLPGGGSTRDQLWGPASCPATPATCAH